MLKNSISFIKYLILANWIILNRQGIAHSGNIKLNFIASQSFKGNMTWTINLKKNYRQ